MQRLHKKISFIDGISINLLGEVILSSPPKKYINRIEALNQINCKSFFHNLKTLCEEHMYSSSNIWNANETSVQARRINNVKVLSKHGSHNSYGVIPKAMELMIVFVYINGVGQSIPNSYIFKRWKRKKNYIEKCEFTPQWACMIKPGLTNTCFGHGCFTFKKIF